MHILQLVHLIISTSPFPSLILVVKPWDPPKLGPNLHIREKYWFHRGRLSNATQETQTGHGAIHRHMLNGWRIQWTFAAWDASSIWFPQLSPHWNVMPLWCACPCMPLRSWSLACGNGQQGTLSMTKGRLDTMTVVYSWWNGPATSEKG